MHAKDPVELVALLARGKARTVAEQAEPGELVIGSDTVVVLGEQVLGKPADAADAAAMLHTLSGNTHHVLTAVSVWRDGSDVCTFVDRVDVTFWELTDEEIGAYVATGEPLDKAGAYGIQGLGRVLVKGIEGDYYTAVGLPVAHLVRELRALGETSA